MHAGGCSYHYSDSWTTWLQSKLVFSQARLNTKATWHITRSTSRPTWLKQKGEKYSNIDVSGPETPLIYFVWPYAGTMQGFPLKGVWSLPCKYQSLCANHFIIIILYRTLGVRPPKLWQTRLVLWMYWRHLTPFRCLLNVKIGHFLIANEAVYNIITAMFEHGSIK